MGNAVIKSKKGMGFMLNIIRLARSSLHHAIACYQLKRILKSKRDGIKIIIGAGSTIFPRWIATDYPVVDVTNDVSMGTFFQPNMITAMLSEHVWEHLDEKLALKAAENCFKYLKAGGYIRLAVPDGYHIDAEYIEEVKPGGTGAGSDDHKVLYNCDSLVALFKKVGFQVKLLEWFDNEGNFHAEDWSEDDGLIMRSTRFDARNKSNPTAYTSLIIDAVKPK